MKRIFALLLALSMVCCLVACGESQSPATTNPTTPSTPVTPPAPPVQLNPVSMGISVGDVAGLLELLGGAAPALDIKDIFVEIAAGESNGVFSLGATMLEEKHVAQLFFGEAFVLSAPTLVDKNYGFTMAGLMDMVENMTGAAVPGAGTAAGALTSLDPEAVVKLLNKYYTLLIDGLKAAEGVTVTTADGKTVITGTLNSDACAVIVVNLIDTLMKDDEFFTLMGQVTGQEDEFKTQFTEGYPGADAALASVKEELGKMAVSLELKNLTLDSKNVPVAADLKFVGSELEVALAYDFAKGTMSGSVKMSGEEMVSVTVGDNKLDASLNIEGQKMDIHMEITDNGMKAYVEAGGQKLAELELSFTETQIKLKLAIEGEVYVLTVDISDSAVSGTLTLNDELMGKVTFDKKVEGTKTTLTLKTLEISNTSIDFSKLGICVYMDTNATLPTAPSDYVDITTLTETELQGILEKFMNDNQDIVDMFANAFGSQEGDVTINSSNSNYAA